MRNFGSNAKGGYSVIELLIVLTIAGILVTFAASQFGTSASNLKRQNIAREFKVSLERARFDAVKRRASNCSEMARVEITSQTSFNLITDVNQNGVLDLETETRTINFAGVGNVQIIAPIEVDALDPIIIRFDQRGHASSGPCGAETAVNTPTTFCNLPCDEESANAENSNMIFVSTTGTSAMLRGGSTLPTFGAPTIAIVDISAQVNPLLAVWDAIVGTPSPTTPTPAPTPTPSPTPSPTPLPTPTPTPTPSPTPSPTPTSSPSPTPTPTPSPSPTPSPTPQACTAGQRPVQDNCECRGTGFYMQGARCRST